MADPTQDERETRRGFLRQLDAMLAEGVPPAVLIPKIESWAEEQSDRWVVISEHLGEIYHNAVEGSEIPEEILDEDGAYRRMRESAKIVRSTIERLMVEVKRQQREGRDVPPADQEGGGMCKFCRESWSEETAVIGFTCEFISEESMDLCSAPAVYQLKER